MSTEEKRRHGSPLRPYGCYAFCIPEEFADVPLHWHGEFELTYVREGSSEFICGDERYRIQAGDVVLTPPNELHAIHLAPGQRQRYDTLVFSPELLASGANDRSTAECITPLVDGRAGLRSHVDASHPAYAEISVAVQCVFACARADTPWQDVLLRSSLLRLLWLLAESGNVVGRDRNAFLSDAMRPVLRYIAENYRETITIDRLAGIAHLSRNYFISRFKQSAGMSPVEYITRQRIRWACERIHKTNDAIAEIAFDSGFRNLSNFNRQFRRIVGCTPLEYRKMNRG